MKAVIIGTGNVASVLGRKIVASGHQVLQVIGRSVERAHELGALLHCASVYNIRYLNPEADVYLLAVSDSHLPVIAAQLKLKDKIVAHTAAALSKEVIKDCSENYGVLYPLQTLHKGVQELPAIPVLIDGNNKNTKDKLVNFSTVWADSVEIADDDERLKTHVAAVFLNNFINHLFALAKKFCEEENLNFSLLYPLIEETVRRVKANNPSSIQTGPAVRRDFTTIDKHLQVLKDSPQMEALYKTLTTSVIDFYDHGPSFIAKAWL